VGVAVDESRRDDVARCVNLTPTAFINATDPSDAPADNGDVASKARTAGPVDHGAVANYEVK
jgi:hypothetical protein